MPKTKMYLLQKDGTHFSLAKTLTALQEALYKRALHLPQKQQYNQEKAFRDLKHFNNQGSIANAFLQKSVVRKKSGNTTLSIFFTEEQNKFLPNSYFDVLTCFLAKKLIALVTPEMDIPSITTILPYFPFYCFLIKISLLSDKNF